jgi:hypothetical protein
LGKKQNDADGKRKIKTIKSKLNGTSSSMVPKGKWPIQNCFFFKNWLYFNYHECNNYHHLKKIQIKAYDVSCNGYKPHLQMEDFKFKYVSLWSYFSSIIFHKWILPLMFTWVNLPKKRMTFDILFKCNLDPLYYTICLVK